MKSNNQYGTALSDAAIAAVNIGPRERRRRHVMGIVFLVVGAGLAFLMVAYNAPILYRLTVFFPLWMAGLGLFQARGKT